jgi:DNA repair exonuclease SbcCD ATPase subunit
MSHLLPVILGYQVYVGIIEIIVFLLGGIVLGFFIHFFIYSRKLLPFKLPQPERPVLSETAFPPGDEWRLKYYEEMELQEKVQMQLRRQLDEVRENEELLTIEVEELQKEVKRLQAEPPPAPVVVKAATSQEEQSEEYLTRLEKAQENLTEQNQNIALLLDQIELLKQTEYKHIDTLKANEELTARLNSIEATLSEKDARIQELQQQQLLSGEMEERLQKAYEEFNSLREKLQKVEGLAQPQNRQFEYEELQQNHLKLIREFDEYKQKHHALLEENQRLSRLLGDTEDKLRESNFQRQQLSKKITFLEELNRDLQQISEHNKKLENQLKRMSEIEVMLARVQGKKPDKTENEPPE